MSDPFNEGRKAAQARKMRSWGIALVLLAFVVVIFAVTVAKIGGNIGHGGG